MNAYRETAAGAPLVTMLANHVVALDPEAGAVLWKQPLERRVTRIIVNGGIVFVAADDEAHNSTIFMFDLRTGAANGSLPLPFRCLGALVSGDRMYFSGESSILAVRTDGRPMFRIGKQKMKESWSEIIVDLVANDATGAETWRWPNAKFDNTAVYLSVGDDVAQVDIDT